MRGQKRVKVLLVEDHAESRAVLARLLERWGFDVSTADTRAAAFNRLAAPFDALIADIMLPDGTGFSVAREAKRRQESILAVALSAYSSAAHLRLGRIAGFDHYLTKPFNCDEIRTLLTIHCRQLARSERNPNAQN